MISGSLLLRATASGVLAVLLPSLSAQVPTATEIQTGLMSEQRVDWLLAIAGSQDFFATNTVEAGQPLEDVMSSARDEMQTLVNKARNRQKNFPENPPLNMSGVPPAGSGITAPVDTKAIENLWWPILKPY